MAENKKLRIQDLAKIRDKAKSLMTIREGQGRAKVTVHMGTCGIAAGARDILAALMDELGQAKISNVSLQQTGCAGLCDQEPMLTLTDKAGGAFRYGRLDKHKVGAIVRDHVLRGQPVLEYLIKA